MTRSENAGAHAAGWYPDPGDQDRLRYWDGNSWTEQRRDTPSWGRSGSVGPPPPKPRRWFAIGLVVVAVAGTILTGVAMATVGTRPPRTIHDSAFEHRADVICKARVAEIRPVASDPQAPAPSLKPAVLRRRIDETANAISATAATLRSLPVNDADRPAVLAWLTEWDRYAAVGHRYADALRAGDPRTYTRIERMGNGPAHRIGRFARGNHIDHCVL